MLRSLLAPNASPMTLDGTRTYLVGERQVAIIDPGPDHAGHQDAVADAVGSGVVACVLLTHGHADHAAGAAALAERLRTRIGRIGDGTLRDGDRLDTDAGPLVVVATPGHTPDHAAFHWPAQEAVFCGDLMMGGLDTALVAPPEGDLADYLDSLARVRALAPRIIHPAHGPAFEDPAQAIDAYVEHRRAREQAVLAALAEGAREDEEIVAYVYGPGLPAELAGVARGAVRAYLQHLGRTGRLPRG